MLKADNLPPSCAVVTKSGNLNLLEPSGPLQAFNGTALPYLAITGSKPRDMPTCTRMKLFSKHESNVENYRTFLPHWLIHLNDFEGG